VHRRERQSAAGQGGIDAAESERQRRRRVRVRAPALEPRDGVAELVEGWGFRGGVHGEVRILFCAASVVKRLRSALKIKFQGTDFQSHTCHARPGFHVPQHLEWGLHKLKLPP
jgi:hypothetical protein